jgi:hypothetical protein
MHGKCFKPPWCCTSGTSSPHKAATVRCSHCSQACGRSSCWADRDLQNNLHMRAQVLTSCMNADKQDGMHALHTKAPAPSSSTRDI